MRKVDIQIAWRGAGLDQILDEGHARLSGQVAKLLKGWDWEVEVEVSFAHFGERGSIDLLAWHRQTATLLVIEIKTESAQWRVCCGRWTARCDWPPGPRGSNLDGVPERSAGWSCFLRTRRSVAGSLDKPRCSGRHCRISPDTSGSGSRHRPGSSEGSGSCQMLEWYRRSGFRWLTPGERDD